ncbi:MAG: hypothetical protein ACFBRM_12880 [Pikeienuella sp.]
MRAFVLLTAGLMTTASLAWSGEVEILAAEASRAPDGTWRISVTVAHADTGWEHYADAWRVLAPDGAILGTRTLYHPHVEEQPFTRSLSGVTIPEDVAAVSIEARDSVHGWAPRAFPLTLPR